MITWEDWKMQELDQQSYTHQTGGKHKLLETRVVIIIAQIRKPCLGKVGYTGYSTCPVIPSFHEHWVCAQYLENELTESEHF